MAKFKFANPDTAQGFSDGLADPEGFDVYATVEGDVLELLGVDDHPMMKEIERLAIEAGATRME